jgi:hypothetical protein
MWQRDEFLALDAVAERNRALLERMRIRSLLDAGGPTPAAHPSGGGRRTLARASARVIARVIARAAQAAWAAARRLDPEVHVRA